MINPLKSDPKYLKIIFTYLQIVLCLFQFPNLIYLLTFEFSYLFLAADLMSLFKLITIIHIFIL